MLPLSNIPGSGTAADRPVPARARPDRLAAGLLAAGVVAGPLYVAVSLVEAATREGFDPTRHAWSMLANGSFGWVHSTNLIVSGILVIAAAIGLHRTSRSLWGAALLALYGFGMVGAGLFTADPGRGFPVGTPEVTSVSWHGSLHFAFGGVGFVGLAAACLILGRRLLAGNHRRLALFSRVTGIVFLVAFVALATTGGSPWGLLGFTGAVILASGWLSAICVHYVRVGN